MTPRAFCRASLAALEASAGRSRKRKRDQTPDAIGLALKRELLERGVQDDPAPAAFEAWLSRHADNPMALALLDEWRLAQAVPAFAQWLERGAPSEDAEPPGEAGGARKGIASVVLGLLAAMALTGCEPNKQAVPDPAQPPKPRVAAR